MKPLLLALTTALIALPAAAQTRDDYSVQHVEAAYEDVFQDVQDAIINRGLVIDYIGHSNAMLERTSAVSGSGDSQHPSAYSDANYVLFCSSKLTHDATKADPYNLATCPYTIFLFETHEAPGRVAVGYRKPAMDMEGPTLPVMQAIDALLADIVSEATE